MPTYEKWDADGTVLERSVTMTGHPSQFDEQMAALAADPDSPWHLVDDQQLAQGGEVTQHPVLTGEYGAESVPAPTTTDSDAEQQPASDTSQES